MKTSTVYDRKKFYCSRYLKNLYIICIRSYLFKNSVTAKTDAFFLVLQILANDSQVWF